LQKAKVEITKVTVPGALEIPHVISMAEEAKSGFDGYVALAALMVMSLWAVLFAARQHIMTMSAKKVLGLLWISP